MKTLNEQVKEITMSTMSKSNKKAALIKLGITPYEAFLLTDEKTAGNQDYTRALPSRISYTFGVEIECGVERGALRDAANQTGLNYQYEGYNHHDGHSHFKFVTDGSLRLNNAIECVSPVLRGADGKKKLKNVCKTLNEAGARVDRSCGLHVHIGAKNLTGKQYTNVFVNYQKLESLIDSFMAESRRRNNNYYCASMLTLDFSHCNSASDVQRIVRQNRYTKVNAMAYNAHKTIEFRQHQGTTNYDKIMNWVSFCGKLVVWSKSNRLSEDITNINDVPFLNEKEKAFFAARIAEFAA